MRIVQEYLRITDRGRLLDNLVYDMISNTHLLLEYRDMSIAEIQDRYRSRLNGFIDYLLSVEAIPSDHMVLYMCEASLFDKQYNHEDKSLCLIDLNEIREDILATGYAFELSDWEETLGYLVADNKLTQDYMIELLTHYLNEISFFGMDPVRYREKIDEVKADLDQAMKEIEEGRTIPADEAFADIRREYILPIDEKDEKQDELDREISKAAHAFFRYCHWRERSRILESLGETATNYEKIEDYQISKKTLTMIDQSMDNLKQGKVSKDVDISEFDEAKQMELFKKDGDRERAIKDIKSLMETLKLTAKQAMDALKISPAEQKKYISML